MDNNPIDRLPVSQLPDRYNLVRSAIYTRLEALGIETERIGNRSYVNAEQLRLLDNLHEFIQAGGTTAEFLESRGLQKRRESGLSSGGLSSGASSGLSSQSELSQLFSALNEFATRLQPALPPPDRLAYFDKLEKAARNGWLLRTSEIADLLGLPVAEIQLYGDRFSEAGFVFVKAGYRAGGEIAWRVSKALK